MVVDKDKGNIRTYQYRGWFIKLTRCIGGTTVQINTYSDVDELAKYLVMDAMKKSPDDDLIGKHPIDSIFYKAYNELSNRNEVIGAYFAIHMKEKYEITFPIR